MKSRTLLALLVASVVSLSGCSSMIQTNREARTAIDSAEGKATVNLGLLKDTASPAQLVTVSELPYVNTQAVTYDESYPTAFNETALLNAPSQSVWSLMQQLSSATGYRVVASDELTNEVSSADVAASPKDAKSAPASGKIRRSLVGPIAYQGTLKGEFDKIAGSLDATWKFDRPTRTLTFFRYETRTFSIASVPGSATSSSDMGTAQDGVQGGMGQAIKVGASGTSTKYDTASLNVWNTIKTNVSPMLSADGTLSISEPTTSITVRDRWDRIDQVAQYVQALNDALTMQVKVNVVVYRINRTKSDSRGFNWSVLYNTIAQRAGQFGASITTPRPTDNGLSSLIITSPNTNENGNTEPFAGSQAFVDALTSIGDTSVVTQGTVVTVNNVPAPLKVFTSQGYLAQTTSLYGNGTTGSSPVGAGATLTPGTVETGFSMNVLPSVQPDGHRILLQMAMTLSSLDDMVTVTSGGQSIQVPTVSGRQLMPRAWLRSGQTLVLAGFEDHQANRSTATPFGESTWALGGNRKTGTTEDALVVVITPVATSNQTSI